MIEIFEKLIVFINHYGITAILIISAFILIRIISSLASKCRIMEKYYSELLLNLGIWKNSLNDRLTYYHQPGSEYDDSHTKSPNYVFYSQSASAALKVIREQIHVGRIFLSKKSISVIETLIAEHWCINEHKAICTADYLIMTLEEVEKSYNSILADAQQDFKKKPLPRTTEKCCI